MSEIAQLVSNVGFPIAACICMGWFSYTMVTKVNDTMTNVQVTLAKLSDSIDDLTNEVRTK